MLSASSSQLPPSIHEQLAVSHREAQLLIGADACRRRTILTLERMAFVIIFVLAFILAFVLQFTVKCQWVSITVPVVCFVGFVLFDAYVLPYRGGGASMWPIAIIFGVPVVVAGGLLGVNVGRRFIKPRQGGKKCVLTLCSCRRRWQRATFSIASGAGAAQQNVRHPMQKYNCPKCGQASFSFWQKQFLGPLGSIPCGACGASVSVPWGKSIALNAVFIPIASLGGLVAAFSFAKYSIGAAFFVFIIWVLAFFVLVGWIQHRFVPLIVKDA